MENLPARKRSSLTPVQIFLAGVFLMGAIVLALLFSPGTSEPLVRPAAAPVLPVVTYGTGGGAGVASAAASPAGTVQSPDASWPGRPADSVPVPPSGHLPVRLKIPALGVDTGIQYVGLTKDGNMDTPKSAVDVAWYKLGPAPGSPGSAVIAGHINTRYSAHGVFEHLDDLNAGDTVQVVAAGGKILNFKVTGKEYLGDADPAISVFARTDGTRLNLVTCAGTWNAERKSFDKRLVVYTELE